MRIARFFSKEGFIEIVWPLFDSSDLRNFQDDYRQVNYLDDYEHAVRLLRTGGILLITDVILDLIIYYTNIFLWLSRNFF